jgi:hypothetical protein
MPVRFLAFFFILFCLSMIESAYSQEMDTLSVDYTEQTVEYILTDLEKLYQVEFAYSSSRLAT